LHFRYAIIESQQTLQEVVEMEEAYGGRKPRKQFPENRPTISESNIVTNSNKRDMGINKIPVIAVVERKDQVVKKSQKGFHVKSFLIYKVRIISYG
jgi:hypothetical protein